MDNKFTITVSIPTDEGFVGRACNNPECGQYFKIFIKTNHDVMFCPYCGAEFLSNDLLTSDQINFVKEAAKEKAFVYIQEQFQNMLKETFGTSSSRGSGITYKPGRIEQKIVAPKYKERKVDSELDCTKCHTKFQVYGIFGYCPGCKEENLLIYYSGHKIVPIIGKEPFENELPGLVI